MRFKNLIGWAIGAFTLSSSLQSIEVNTPPFMSENFVINNRILLKVNGKPITVWDVAKKMDILFYRQYPELAASLMARYQFYMSSWKAVLEAVINDQLILADAKEKKIEITEGEVREQLEKLFGPDVVLNINQLGMTYEEACEQLKTELTVQRMTSAFVHPKAMLEVKPQRVKTLYQQMLLNNPPQDMWKYRVLTIRGEGEEIPFFVQKVQHLIEEGRDFEHLPSSLGETEKVKISLSEEYQRQEKELSETHKAILMPLEEGGISLQQQDNAAKFFFLKEHQKSQSPSFQLMEKDLKAQLSQQMYAQQYQAYCDKLYQQYGLTKEYLADSLHAEMEPFALR